jgi:hypothetical protein
MSREMARSTAHQSTFDAALGFRRRNCCQGKETATHPMSVFILISSHELAWVNMHRRELFHIALKMTTAAPISSHSLSPYQPDGTEVKISIVDTP